MKHKASLKKTQYLEDELIICCIKGLLDRNPNILKDYPLQQIDWTYLLETAKKHRVLPLIFWSISSASQKLIPKNAWAQLKADYNNNASYNLKMTSELFKLLALFTSNSIRAIPFKGPILAFSLYGNIALRQFQDLDVLVHPDDFIKAKDMVLSEGYLPQQDYSTEQIEALIKNDQSLHDLKFSKPNLGINLELHWKVHPRMYPSGLENHDLFERAESLIIFSNEILSFSPEDLLLYLCFHGTKHQWKRLSWLCDVAMLSRKRTIDWQFVIEFARKAGIERSLHLALILACDLLEAPIPKDALKEAQRDERARSLSNQIKANMFGEAKDGLIREWISHLRTTGNKPEYFLFVLKVILLPNQADRDYIILPKSLYFAYFLIRPIRILRVYLLSHIRSFSRSRDE